MMFKICREAYLQVLYSVCLNVTIYLLVNLLSACHQHVVTDETSRVFSERDMRTLRDLSIRTNAATSYLHWKRAVTKVFGVPVNGIDLPYMSLYEIDREKGKFRRGHFVVF